MRILSSKIRKDLLQRAVLERGYHAQHGTDPLVTPATKDRVGQAEQQHDAENLVASLSDARYYGVLLSRQRCPLDPSGTETSAAPEKYSHIDFKPPAGVSASAKKGLEYRKKVGRGGTEVGVARARDLSGGGNISPSTARRMNSYFARHAVDKSGDGWGSSSEPSAGYVAWLLWGGDAGASWASKLCKQMDSADQKA